VQRIGKKISQQSPRRCVNTEKRYLYNNLFQYGYLVNVNVMTQPTDLHARIAQVLNTVNASLNTISTKAGRENKDLYNKYEKLKALYRNAADEMKKGDAANLQRVQFIIKLIVADLEKDIPAKKK
jgi:hypothetical protein